MPFGKAAFAHLGPAMRLYLKNYPCGVLTVTLKVYGKEYNVVQVLSTHDDVVTFLYYDDKKAVELPHSQAESKAWPALTVPYEVIEYIEFNPGKPSHGKQTLGFKLDKND
jgi:hypothetical protein